MASVLSRDGRKGTAKLRIVYVRVVTICNPEEDVCGVKRVVPGVEVVLAMGNRLGVVSID